MTASLLLTSTFILVLALGLQSRFVNHSQYFLAWLNSFVISGGNLILLKLSPNATGWEIAAYMLGGPFGITTSIYLHDRYLKKKKAITEGDARIEGLTATFINAESGGENLGVDGLAWRDQAIASLARKLAEIAVARATNDHAALDRIISSYARATPA